MDVYRKITITKNRGDEYRKVIDPVAVETKVRIVASGKHLLSLSCTPAMVRELITGFLLTENIIADAASLSPVSIQYGKEILVELPPDAVNSSHPELSRSLGGITVSREETFQKKIRGDVSLPAASLKSVCREFQSRSELFRMTGCFHSAAVSDGTQVLAFAEDVGRHNAVDKIIGYAALNSVPLGGMIMLVSCRVSSDIIAKCLRWDIPVLASRAAPTELSVRLAEESGMTLVGFVRGDGMNIYTHGHRILR